MKLVGFARFDPSFFSFRTAYTAVWVFARPDPCTGPLHLLVGVQRPANKREAGPAAAAGTDPPRAPRHRAPPPGSVPALRTPGV